jgi:hypothetical protein
MVFKYFQTYDEALSALTLYQGQTFPNVYQFKGENTSAQIREFKKGFAIQFGDCGHYLEVNQ